MQLIFVFVETDNEDVGKPVSDYFGITGDAPTVMFFFLTYEFSFFKKMDFAVLIFM